MNALERVHECIQSYQRMSSQDIDGMLKVEKELAAALWYLAGAVSKANIDYLESEAQRKNECVRIIWENIDAGNSAAKSEIVGKKETANLLTLEHTSKGVHDRLKNAYGSASRVFDDIRTQISYLKREKEHSRNN